MQLSICEKVHPCLSKLAYANLCSFWAKSTVSCITGICGTVLRLLEHWTYHRFDTLQRCTVCSDDASFSLPVGHLSGCAVVCCCGVLWSDGLSETHAPALSQHACAPVLR